MKVTLQNGLYGATRYPVERITKNFIVVRVNDIATIKYRRRDGFRAPREALTRREIDEDELARLNEVADSNGGTWEAPRPRRSKKEEK